MLHGDYSCKVPSRCGVLVCRGLSAELSVGPQRKILFASSLKLDCEVPRLNLRSPCWPPKVGFRLRFARLMTTVWLTLTAQCYC